MSPRIYLALFSSVVLILSGCGSSKIKERKEQRDAIAKQAGLYCEFINGEIFPDIDVALNIEMAKRCDSGKPYSISTYRTPSENQGVMYCCSMAKEMSAPMKAEPKKVEPKAEPKVEAKADAKAEPAKPAAAAPAAAKANSSNDEEE